MWAEPVVLYAHVLFSLIFRTYMTYRYHKNIVVNQIKKKLIIIPQIHIRKNMNIINWQICTTWKRVTDCMFILEATLCQGGDAVFSRYDVHSKLLLFF